MDNYIVFYIVYAIVYIRDSSLKRGESKQRKHMNKSYEVVVSMTGKAISKQEPYSMFHREVKNFSTLAEVKDFLQSEYGTARKVKMYADTKDGQSRPVGYIYHFRDKDWSHDEPEYLREDWVEVYEVKRKRVIIK